MPLIHVDLGAGRANPDQRAELVDRITEAVSQVLGERQRTMTVVTLIETPAGPRSLAGKSAPSTAPLWQQR